MGANCCVAAKEKPLPYQGRFEVSTRRNIRYSPSWSFRWDNRTYIEDIMNTPAQFSHHNSENFGSENKSWAESEPGGLSEGGSPLDASRMLAWQKSVMRTGTSTDFKIGASGHSVEGNSPEGKSSKKSSGNDSVSDIKSLSISSTLSSSLFRVDPSSSRSCTLPCHPTSARKSHHSPVHPLSRQVSDITIPVKSLTENCSPEDRQSFVLSVCSNDLLTGGSQCGSSDGWSMRTFSELVASSQKERWSFDSGSPNFVDNNMAISNRKKSTSLSTDLQTCGICLKQIKDRSPLISASNEVAVVAVLICEHVYHAECLEIVTPETDRYDPSCPICMYGGKYRSKLLANVELKARNKISRIAVADADSDSDPISEHLKRGKSSKLEASSSMKSSFTWPFLRRYFSFGSRPPVRLMSDGESSRKGFWARYQRA